MIYYGQSSRLTRAEEAGYVAHGDDLLPPASHLPTYTDAEFGAAIAATPFGCSDCNGPVFEDDMAPSCGAHYLCVPCYTTSDFRCRECRRVQQEMDAA